MDAEHADKPLSATDAIDVPGYVIGPRLGSGGIGEVFEARHAVIGREVAIKVLHAKYSTDATAMARFVAEARAVNQISHPDIVQVFDFGTLADGRQYCVMERIRGTTLRDVLRARGRLPFAEALPILRGIAGAVDAAHAAGIAHRDLKPDNVFVLDGGGIKLIDFGLAKLLRDDPQATPVTQTGAVFGTPMYMSPEQCRGKTTDLRTDCYSFGVLAYHMLVGEPPWSGDALELALHHLHDMPDPPSKRCAELPARVDRVVLALLAKSPLDRPSPLREAVEAISGTAELPGRRRIRRSAVIAALVAVAVAAVVVLALGRHDADPIEDHRKTAETGSSTVAIDRGSATKSECDALPLTSPPLTMREVSQAAREPRGGAVVSGTYILTGSTIHGKGVSVPWSVRGAMVIDGTRYRYTFEHTLVSNVTTNPMAGTLTISGRDLVITNNCPGIGRVSLRYDATPTSVTIYQQVPISPDRTLAMVFTKQ